VVNDHPNATATAIAGSITIVAVWLAGVVGVDVPAEVASAFTTIVAGLVLLAAGRRRSGPSKPARSRHRSRT
jgi:hypothetical protein